MPSWKTCVTPYSVAKSRTSLCRPAEATVFAGRMWSKTRITRSGSQGGRPVCDRVAAGQPVAGHHRALPSETRRVEDLVGRRVAQHRVGVHARLVMKGGLAGNRGVERHLDSDHGGDHPVEFGKDLE